MYIYIYIYSRNMSITTEASEFACIYIYIYIYVYPVRWPDHQGNQHSRESCILAPGRPRMQAAGLQRLKAPCRGCFSRPANPSHLPVRSFPGKSGRPTLVREHPGFTMTPQLPVSEKNIPPENNTLWNVGFQSTKSGAGGRFLLQGSREKADTQKGMFFSQTTIWPP